MSLELHSKPLRLRAAGVCAGLTILSSNACYTYRPLPDPSPKVGSQVSARLTKSGSQDLAGEVGSGVRYVEGTVIALDSTTLHLAVLRTETDDGARIQWSGERVKLPDEAVARLEQRHFAVGATGLVVGGVVVGLVAAFATFGSSGSSSGNGGGTGPPSVQ